MPVPQSLLCKFPVQINREKIRDNRERKPRNREFTGRNGDLCFAREPFKIPATTDVADLVCLRIGEPGDSRWHWLVDLPAWSFVPDARPTFPMAEQQLLRAMAAIYVFTIVFGSGVLQSL